MIWLSQNWQGLVGLASMSLNLVLAFLHFFHVSGAVVTAIEGAKDEIAKLPGSSVPPVS